MKKPNYQKLDKDGRTEAVAKMPPGYRILQDHEEIQEGDLAWLNVLKRFHETSFVGCRANLLTCVIRKVEVKRK